MYGKSFLAYLQQNNGCVNILQYWTEIIFKIAKIFKLHKPQTSGVMKMHNMSKIWFANNKFSLWKNLVYD